MSEWWHLFRTTQTIQSQRVYWHIADAGVLAQVKREQGKTTLSLRGSFLSPLWSISQCLHEWWRSVCLWRPSDNTVLNVWMNRKWNVYLHHVHKMWVLLSDFSFSFLSSFYLLSHWVGNCAWLSFDDTLASWESVGLCESQQRHVWWKLTCGQCKQTFFFLNTSRKTSDLVDKGKEKKARTIPFRAKKGTPLE